MTSPSTARRIALLALLAAAPGLGQTPDSTDAHAHHDMDHGAMGHDAGAPNSTDMIVHMLREPMLPGLKAFRPNVNPYLPGADMDPASVPLARPRELLELADGDSIALEAGFVRRRVRDREFVMYGFNGQYPGPLIKVDQATSIVVGFTNNIEQPTTIHWHGIRLDNRFDGVAHLTQDPVPPGGTFRYEIRFPDAGIYWYHPHMREDIQQDMGLYGNIFVKPEEPGYFSPVNREEFLVLDDLLVDGDSLIPYGEEAANFAIMGRFGNVFLVNGEADWKLEARAGEVVRYFITNVSNSRTFNLSFGGAPIKLVGADLSLFEREMMVESVAIVPAQRYVVEVHYPRAGEYPLENRVQALDHMKGEFVPAVDRLGLVSVSAEPARSDHLEAFRTLRENGSVTADIARYREHFDRPVDHDLLLTVDIQGLPILLMQFISIDTIYRPPVEWTDGMADMNWLSTSKEVRWILRETSTGRENMDIHWTHRVGDVIKIRLRNDPDAFHPMNHPIHLHGQRLLVLSRDGVPNRNMVWKDTEVVPVGTTMDVLVELTNPGTWMLHCHIAEHLEAGMMMAFDVEE